MEARASRSVGLAGGGGTAAARLIIERSGLIHGGFEILLAVAERNAALAGRHTAIGLAIGAPGAVTLTLTRSLVQSISTDTRSQRSSVNCAWVMLESAA